MTKTAAMASPRLRHSSRAITSSVSQAEYIWRRREGGRKKESHFAFLGLFAFVSIRGSRKKCMMSCWRPGWPPRPWLSRVCALRRRRTERIRGIQAQLPTKGIHVMVSEIFFSTCSTRDFPNKGVVTPQDNATFLMKAGISKWG